MENDLETLRQEDRRKQIQGLGTGPWTTVYESWQNASDNGAHFSALAPKSYRPRALASSSWDLSIGDGMPGFTQFSHPTRTKYLRFGNTKGVEPVVLLQEHHGMRPRMLPQVSEEFRMYHNLWIDPSGMTMFKIEDDGTEYEAVRISDKKVEIRTNLLRQFQAGRQLDLLLFTDSIQNVPAFDGVDVDALTEELSTPLSMFTFNAGDRIRPGTYFSRLNGVKVIPAPARSKAGIWPYDEKTETYPEFIIGEDENGEPIRHTCNDDQLANYFGKNPDSPHYLTPVFFRREVLQRYYELPEKYSVEDGYLRCGSLWGVQIDNDHPRHVMVFLGDLGRDLPEKERNYWLTFNIAPTGTMSSTVFKRSFLSQFADAEAPDLKFKSLYQRFNRQFAKIMGWSLFKDPEADDEHVLQRLRIPLNQSQPEFESQILNLTKVLVDALNEKGVIAQLSNKIDNEKGLDKLRRWLEQENYPFVARDIGYLKRLQSLRSKLAAHRKGSDYKKVLQQAKVDNDPIKEVVHLLWNACGMLEDLADHFNIDLQVFS
jgi:hypothetical protein